MPMWLFSICMIVFPCKKEHREKKNPTVKNPNIKIKEQEKKNPQYPVIEFLTRSHTLPC